MAGRNAQVTVEFHGDDSQLQRTFDNVGGGARDMARDVDRSSRDLSEGFDRVGDGADNFEQKTIGLRDAITGTGDVMRGFKEGDMTLVLTGFADLASSVANFAGPVIKSVLTRLGILTTATVAQTGATTAATGAQTGLNTAMRLNPIGLVVTAIVALGAAFVIAYQKSETFRNIVDGAVRAVGDAAIWVKDRFVDLWNFIRDLPGRIADVAGRVAGSVTSMIPGSGVVGSVIGKIGGLFHDGGIVPGPPGATVPVLAQAGERITPAGQTRGGGTTVVVNVAGSVITERDLGRIIADQIRNNRLIGVTA